MTNSQVLKRSPKVELVQIGIVLGVVLFCTAVGIILDVTSEQGLNLGASWSDILDHPSVSRIYGKLLSCAAYGFVFSIAHIFAVGAVVYLQVALWKSL